MCREYVVAGGVDHTHLEKKRFASGKCKQKGIRGKEKLGRSEEEGEKGESLRHTF